MESQTTDIISTFPSESQLSSTSQISEPSVKQRLVLRPKEVRRVSKREVDQLNERVKHEYQRNKKTYDKLIAINPYFTMKLYSPHNNFTTEDFNTNSLSLMMKQLQLLLDDGRTLEKQIMKAQLKKMKRQYLNSFQGETRHHYAYLRKIWLNQNQCESNDPLDKIDQLNKKVVLVKQNLFSMVDGERHSQRNSHIHEQYGSVNWNIKEIVSQMGDYQELRQKYQNLRMAYEEIYQKLEANVQEMKRKVGERNEIVRELKFDNEEFKRVNKVLKEKLLGSEVKESQLLIKIKQIQSKMKQSQMQEAKLLSPRSTKIQEIVLQEIKFQKMGHKQFLSKTQHTITVNPSLKEQTSLQKLKERGENMFLSPVVKKQSEQNTNLMNNQSRYDPSDFNDARSIDGKKGRFTRMRSPAGGKLLKNKGTQELPQKLKLGFGSPSLRESKQTSDK